MFELITAKFDCHCAISGRLIKQGQDMYYNYITKTCIHPLEYEQSKKPQQQYFQRHQKLNK
jgi:hypothetical protein